ncbi:MAG: MarR family transcriptional regulator [Archangiaceae bacterium]|nr:MarR family transcriptional regulator [Archangiaceae bacterium]
MKRDVFAVLVAYPQIWHACHTQHQRGARSGHPLTEREASLLAHVSAFAPASPKALAEHLGLAPATLSALIDTLLGRGFLQREQHRADRRRHELRLTPQGEAAVLRASVLDASRVQRVLAKLSPPARKRAVDGIALLASACRGTALPAPSRSRRRPTRTDAQLLEGRRAAAAGHRRGSRS